MQAIHDSIVSPSMTLVVAHHRRSLSNFA